MLADLYTIPSQQELKELTSHTPINMWPHSVPFAVVLPGYLTDEQCEAMTYVLGAVGSYTFPHCDAKTTEAPQPLHEFFYPLKRIALEVNEQFFKYELDEQCWAWLQTYHPGMSYPLHMDGAPGQTRKLTAIALLSNPREYSGGGLVLTIPPGSFNIPRKRGTVVVFPQWVLHQVMQVNGGLRQTINMGFFGQPWR